MKRYTTASIAILFFLTAFPVNASHGLSGHIYLQVQEHGEAWYIDPVSDERVYIKNGEAAYSALRTFGLGITNEDLERIYIGEIGVEYDAVANPDPLAHHLSGRILIQVEENGEAWYINPNDERRYYLADGEAAYEMMRYLGVGITNSDLNTIALYSSELDCYKSMDCFSSAVATDISATTLVTTVIDLFGPVTLLSRYDHEVLGNGSYLFRSTVLETDLDEAITDGITGYTLECTHSDKATFQAILEQWSQGNMSTSDLDFASCEQITP